MQRQVHDFRSKAAGKLRKGKANMARATGIEGIALGILAMLLPAAPASAQSIRGSVGPTSQAEVRISVRVMPRFKVQTNSAAQAPKGDVGAVAFSSNTPSLRYALVPQPAPEARRTGKERLLVLVVPD